MRFRFDRMWPAGRFELQRLHAQIILNNRDAYSDAETSMTECYLSTDTAQALLRAAKAMFLGQYYADYPLPEKR